MAVAVLWVVRSNISWCNDSRLYWKPRVVMYDATFVVIGGKAGCRHDNLLWHQWWQSWHRDVYRCSMSHPSFWIIIDTDSLPHLCQIPIWSKARCHRYDPIECIQSKVNNEIITEYCFIQKCIHLITRMSTNSWSSGYIFLLSIRGIYSFCALTVSHHWFQEWFGIDYVTI